jgi:hypothetical protein
MKGAVASCLRDLVIKKFGIEKWEACLTTAGVPKNSIFLASQDVDDATVMKIINAVCKVANLTLAQAADAFGEHWVCSYAAGIYKAHYAGVSTARQFLLKLDEVHRITTETIPNAHPPRFDYTWENDKTLIMKYKSQRGLLDLLLGLVKGVGRYFKEDVRVTKNGPDSLRVVFSR